MKILKIISGDLWAGAEVMAFSLIKNLSTYNDIELSVIVLNEGKLSNIISILPIKTRVVNEKKLNFFSIYKEIKQWTTLNPQDIIHSHRYKENILAYMISRNIDNIKLVSTQHGIPNSEQAGKNLKFKHRLVIAINNKILCEKFDKFIVVSKDMEEHYKENYSFSENVLQMIHNGIIMPKGTELNRDKKPFLIGSVGRLFPVKDYHLFVQIAFEISKVRKDIKFLLAGDGPERDSIEKLVNEYGLQGSFEIKGFVDDTDKFYHNLDIYINTSLYEGIPMSVLEAMGHGVPVIAANVGGMKEIIASEEEGILIDSRNPKDYAEKCLFLFQDAYLRKSIGLKGKEKILNAFSVDKMAKEYYSLYSKLLS